MQVTVPISIGELVDKITILEIKRRLLADPEKQRYIRHELTELDAIYQTIPHELEDLKHELLTVNTDLWYIEEFKRKCEREQAFDIEFVEASRSVYLKNDYRARIKQQINQRVGSLIQEQKSHQGI